MYTQRVKMDTAAGLFYIVMIFDSIMILNVKEKIKSWIESGDGSLSLMSSINLIKDSLL